MSIRDEDALEYHDTPIPGKVEVVPTKPCMTQRDLGLAYTPGVAVPCLAIEKDPSKAFRYTAKGNLVAVISNGTAVLGLGDIGALAGKPVMEGKGVLFKRFADVNVFDIELNSKDPKEIIRICQALEPTFGGINLEDIKAPECFEIEEELKKTMKIPVFHDDQHGTAIISGAALLNAIEVTGKRIDKIKVVFNGAGAAGTACALHFIELGVKKENLILCDSKGAIYKGRPKGMNKYKEMLAADTKARTLADAMKGADVFCGCSVANTVTPPMLLSMAKDPVVFAMANPDPEITYPLAIKTRKDVIMATGRSDYPNQVNNVLGFPFIFRGALDAAATAINQEMKVAATKALAALAKQDVPDSVCRAYGVKSLEFGREYLIPKPFDPRVLIWEASAVAEAAIKTGVAKKKLDIEEYKRELERRQGRAMAVKQIVIQKAQRKPMRVVFPEGNSRRILRACQILLDEGIAKPILIGSKDALNKRIKELKLNLKGVEIVDMSLCKKLKEYSDEFYRLRQRHGVTRGNAGERIRRNPIIFGAMMVHMKYADALVCGLTHAYPQTIRPALQVIKVRKGQKKVAGVYMVITKKNKVYFLADATVNIDPSAEDLAEIALMTADTARRYDIEPRVAMLSFSNFGSTKHPFAEKVRKAVQIVKERAPGLMVDGEMQADTAVTPGMIEHDFPFCELKGGANVLIFPDLQSGNITYKLLHRLGEAELIGPILMGMSQPVHVLQRGCEVGDIVNMSAIAVVDAQEASAISFDDMVQCWQQDAPRPKPKKKVRQAA